MTKYKVAKGLLWIPATNRAGYDCGKRLTKGQIIKVNGDKIQIDNEEWLWAPLVNAAVQTSWLIRIP